MSDARATSHSHTRVLATCQLSLGLTRSPTLERTHSLQLVSALPTVLQRSLASERSPSSERSLTAFIYPPRLTRQRVESTYRNALNRSVRALHVTWPDPSIRARISGRGRPLAPLQYLAQSSQPSLLAHLHPWSKRNGLLSLNALYILHLDRYSGHPLGYLAALNTKVFHVGL
mgnify:CR=1 FL=1